MKSAAINPPLWNSYAKHRGESIDWKTMVREIADAGYTGVEMHGNEDSLGPVREMVQYLSDHGLTLVTMAAIITYDPHPPSTENFLKNIRYMAEAGVTQAMCCGGFMPSPRRTTHAFDYDLFGENVEQHCQLAREHGVEVCFHPHRGCIVETADETRELVKRVPELKLCVDVAHLEAVGDDAVAFINEFSDQISLTHIKDYNWELDSFVELGEGDGKLDVAACLKALEAKGYNGWLTIELDKKWREQETRSPLDSAKQIRAWLQKHGY